MNNSLKEVSITLITGICLMLMAAAHVGGGFALFYLVYKFPWIFGTLVALIVVYYLGYTVRENDVL